MNNPILSIWGKWARPDYPNTTNTTIIHISAETTLNSEKNVIPGTKPLALIWSCLRPLGCPVEQCGLWWEPVLYLGSAQTTSEQTEEKFIIQKMGIAQRVNRQYSVFPMVTPKITSFASFQLDWHVHMDHRQSGHGLPKSLCH